eukprot:jgi/Orpsp1_1/1178895/evm.model.c7180000067138.1
MASVNNNFSSVPILINNNVKLGNMLNVQASTDLSNLINSPLVANPNPSGPSMMTSPLIATPNPSGPSMLNSPLIVAPNPSGPSMMQSPLLRTPNPSGPSMMQSPFLQSHNPQSTSFMNSPLITNPNPSGPSMLNSPLLTNTNPASAFTSFSPMPPVNVESTPILNGTFSPVIGLPITTPTLGTGTNIISPIIGTPLIVNNPNANTSSFKQTISTGNESPLIFMNENITQESTGSGIFDNPVITLTNYEEDKANVSTSVATIQSPVVVNSNEISKNSVQTLTNKNLKNVSSINYNKNLLAQQQKYKKTISKT